MLLEASFHDGGARDHVAIKRLGVIERLFGLRRVDDHLVVLVDDVAAVRPQAPVHPGIAVARGVAEREAARRVVRLHRLGVFEELVVGGGEFEKPAFFDASIR